jgi:S1-C subfamily serine protease
MTRLLMTGALAWFLAGGIAVAEDAGPDAAPQNSVKLVRILADLPAGTPYMSFTVGNSFCLGNRVTKTWTDGRLAQQVSPYRPAFKTELTSAGYKVVTPGEDNLFEEEAATADYEAAAVITDEHIEGCMSKGGLFSDRGDARGTGSLTIDWQLYSRLKKEVVAHVTTSGTSRLDHSVPGGPQQLVIAAFTDNVRQLAQNADFRAAMNAPRAGAKDFQMPGQQSKIALAGSLKAGSRKIADATGSVVTIINSTGTGSGFLVSSDGYVLTDAHVVGDDKTVRVRWPDGLEGLATVERASKRRDVAILKTNPRDRSPLALKRGPVTPTQRVYVIGSPNGKAFEGTVSSGIISADRTIDGLRYIQSDAAMSPGSSGGPLLDETGAVIGLSEMHYFNQGQVASLNMFTPIGDAMDFLALEQK